jgi:serine/threonine-protein kinase
LAATSLLSLACSSTGSDGTAGDTTDTATMGSTASTGSTPTTASSEPTGTATDPGTATDASGTTDATSATTDPTNATTNPTTNTTTDATTDPSGDPTTDTGGDDSTLCASQAEGRYFPDDAWFYTDVSQAPTTADSDAITSWMVQQMGPGGWGTGTMRIDFSIVAIDAPAGTTKRDFTIEPDYYYEPDCDTAAVPLPPGGYVEDYPQDPPDPNNQWAGYDCSGFGDGADCHMLVVSRSEQRLYEIYHATVDAGNTFYGGCEAVWSTASAPTGDGRGQQCTSADAAGFPIAPLLFTAEEVKAGVIDHAIRFILPNSMIRTKQYVYPATHGTNTSGPATSIPYGGHMRLKADYPVQNLKPAAQVVARAMQKYGMYMADGGNIALTAQADVVGCATWAEVDLGPQDLNVLKATDFEVIDHGPTIPVTYDCQRTPVTQ